MNPSKPQMNRRDWFRLRGTHSEPSTARLSESGSASEVVPADRGSWTKEDRLRPIDLPPNHDGMDLAQLPPMREALISPDEVGSLFSDLESNATDVQLFQKDAPSQTGKQSGTNALALQFASKALLEGKTQRLQIRYTWDGANWIDTLEARPDGFRLVRIEHREGMRPSAKA